MPKQIPEQELNAILAVVVVHPDSVPVSVIRGGLPYELPPRMLQRRLALLVEQKRLIAEGQGKGRRYRVPVTTTSGKDNTSERRAIARKQSDVRVPVSREAEEVRKIIRVPVQQRQPVGYQCTFLDDYQPNVTFYLPAETRQHLRDMGYQQVGERKAGAFARTIYNRLLIDLSWNSCRLEGNTYSLLETERLLKMGKAAKGRDDRETQMILNHKAAIELLVEHADAVDFNRYTILNLHALLSDNLLGDPHASGRLRRIPVAIHGTVFHPLEVPQIIEECFEKILATASDITDPFEKSFFALVHLPYLQSFEDVNKRVSRLATNIPFIQENFCPLSFVDVPDQAYIDGLVAIYELNRVELMRDVFIWAYERSCFRYSAVRQSLSEPDPFRLRYREMISESVAAVVLAGLDRETAAALIRENAIIRIPSEDQARFVETVETEIMSLHEGNIARYRLRLSDYRSWQQGWR